MTSVAEVVRAAIPDATDDMVQFVLIGRTPAPCGAITARSLYKAASGWRRAGEHGVALCDWCHRPAVDGWTCKPCGDALRVT